MAAGARVYTRAELLSLRAIPDTGRFFARPRSAVRQLFSSGASGFVLVSSPPSPPPSSSSSSASSLPSSSSAAEGGGGGVARAPGALAAHSLAFLPVMRYGRGLASLNLYPTSASCVATNELLWRVAQAGEHDAGGDALLGANVLALVMKEDLFAFLRSVSLRDLRRCILHFLALIAADETPEGLALMADELEGRTWEQLSELRARGERPSKRQLRDVEALRRMCCLSPWRVDVYAAYVTPADMRTVLAARDVAEREDGAAAHAAGTYEAPDISARIRARAPSKNVVYWKLFRDWQVYRRIWVERLRVHPADASSAMMAAITSGRHNEAWYRTEVVLMCAAREGNLFSTLPKDVVCNLLAPHVLLAGCAEWRSLVRPSREAGE